MRQSILVAILLLAGCGESTESKRNRATSQVNVAADKLSEKIGEDGWFVRVAELDDIDPWGNKLTVKYERNGANETLTVRSNGEDGLPLTKDDIAARYHLDSEKAREAQAKELQKTIEGVSKSLTRGLTRGVVDAVKESLKK
jgi:hypothetical protein